MPSDPLSRVEVARNEVDRVFGHGYAASHPDVTIAVLLCSTIDQAAQVIATALLAEPEEPQRHIVPARELLRPRP